MTDVITYSPEDVARRWGVPRDVVLSMIRAGKLHAVRFSRKTIRLPAWTIEEHEAKERLFRIPPIRPNQAQSR